MAYFNDHLEKTKQVDEDSYTFSLEDPYRVHVIEYLKTSKVEITGEGCQAKFHFRLDVLYQSKHGEYSVFFVFVHDNKVRFAGPDYVPDLKVMKGNFNEKIV